MLLTILAKVISVYEESTWNLFNQILVFDFHKGNSSAEPLFEFVCKYPLTKFMTGWFANWKQRAQFVTPIAYSPYHTLLEKTRKYPGPMIVAPHRSMLSESQIYENLSWCAVVTRNKEYCIKSIISLWPGLHVKYT